MIVACDCHYETRRSAIGLVGFDAWAAAQPSWQVHQVFDHSASDYQPGSFYKRELPIIAHALEALPDLPKCVVIDGYVWLNAEGRKGLGAHLHEQFKGQFSVIGVAKRTFRGNDAAWPILRGRSKRPLFVTSEGVSTTEAVRAIKSMAGHHRLPEFLKLADGLARASQPDALPTSINPINP